VIGTATLVLLVGSAASAAAQTFVPDRGEGAVTVMYQGGIVKRHLQVHGSSDAGRIESQGLMTDLSIGLGRKFALSVGLPYIGSRYVGSKPHELAPDEVPLYPNFKSLDDGTYHSTFQDLRVELRYSLRRVGWAVTPFVAGIVPSHDYEFFSHSAIGRRVRELQVGAYAARLLDPWLPGGFFQVGYTHGFEQNIIDIPRQRSILTLEAGYFATSKLRVFGEASGQVTHGGKDIVISARADFHGLEFIHHDQIARSDAVDVGGGAAWTFSDRLDLIGSFTRTVWGINGHAQWGVLTLGMSYGIGPNKRRAASAGSDGSASCHAQDSHEGRLEKCVCLRK
jgi:hypothetical protein